MGVKHWDWKTAWIEIEGPLATAKLAAGPKRVLGPRWDPDGDYQATVVDGKAVIQHRSSGVWVDAERDPPAWFESGGTKRNIVHDPKGMNDPERSKTVFLIHGRNMEARNEFSVFLASVGLTAKPFGKIRASLPGNATVMDVIEKGMKEAVGVVALVTPDEFAALRPQWRNDPHQDLRWQARQNVIFEAGLAYGQDPTRVIIVVMGGAQLWSDISGIHVYYFSDDADKRDELIDQLQTLGCSVHRNGGWTSAGKLNQSIANLDPVSPVDPFQPVAVKPASDPSPVLLDDEATVKILLKQWVGTTHSGEVHHFDWVDRHLGFVSGQAKKWLADVVNAMERWSISSRSEIVFTLRREPPPTPLPRSPWGEGRGF